MGMNRIWSFGSRVFIWTKKTASSYVETLGDIRYDDAHDFEISVPLKRPKTASVFNDRKTECVSLLLFAVLSGRFIRTGLVIVAYGTATAVLMLAVFAWPVFPVCFVDGAGLTLFKKVAEYVICGVLTAAVLLLRRKRKRFDPDVFRLLAMAMLLTMAGELCFTFYVSVYGFSNLAGHYCKILSFFLVYMALIRSGLSRPYSEKGPWIWGSFPWRTGTGSNRPLPIAAMRRLQNFPCAPNPVSREPVCCRGKP